MRLHHVQVSCPPGGEDGARRFYADGLGLTAVPKPAGLAGRGGAWFRAYAASGDLAVELHVGVEESFVPARKAHPAFAAALERAGFTVDWTERTTFAGHERFHTRDAAGNRVEVLAVSPF